ncbi:hypothetical protein OpiT1DRAFT_04791 [Opitutaceae bacterium TAV1]|nr:hypothetical protein OpiT1DRAFT_04791 [Opitutaceae bacterium TAV1]
MSTDRIAHFTALVERQPGNVLFRFSLAQALEAAGRDADAVAHYAQCVSARDDWMMPRILLGKLLLRLGRPAEAKPHLETALRLAIDQHHDDPAAELEAILADLAG